MGKCEKIMDDCVHLHACRRLAGLKGIDLADVCKKDCTAYFKDTGEKYVTLEEAAGNAYQTAIMVDHGYDPEDVPRHAEGSEDEMMWATLTEILSGKEAHYEQ